LYDKKIIYIIYFLEKIKYNCVDYTILTSQLFIGVRIINKTIPVLKKQRNLSGIFGEEKQCTFIILRHTG